MTKAILLRAVCTVALFAAVPALAQQTTTPPASAASPAAQSGSAASSGTTAPKSTMAPKATMGAKAEPSSGAAQASTMPAHPMHHTAMMSHSSMHASRTDASQDAEVNKLNDQSYQAAEKGVAFNSGTPVTGMGSTMPAGSKSGISGGGKN